MKKYIFLTLVSLALVGFSSCGSNSCGGNKKAFLKNFQAFQRNVAKNPPSDWEQADKDFDYMIETCLPKYKDDFTISELTSLNLSIASYFLVRHSGDMNALLMPNKKILRESMQMLKEHEVDFKEMFEMNLSMQKEMHEEFMKAFQEKE